MIRRLVVTAAMIGAAILSMAAAPCGAAADRRVALVVGNSTYQTVPQLPNPSRDAEAITAMFKDAGFDSVDVAMNVGNLEFKRAIRKFESAADQADIAVIYYAGHGLEIGGTNYLIPTDARLASDRDAEDEAIPLERLVSSADGARKLRVIILDACRDNPFKVAMRRERKAATRAVTAGLSKIEPTSTDTLIAYAAKAGSTADDGDGLHSPFTTAVLKNLTVPGLDIRLAFGRVRDEVMKATSSRQEPFVYGSLGGGNISLVPAPVVQQEPPAGDIKADYDLVARINTRRAWEVFLGTYKTGFYADLARVQMASLEQPPAPPKDAGAVAVAVPPGTLAPGRVATAREALDWDKIKDSTDQSALGAFIKRYPDSPLAITARQKLDVLINAAREREEKARAEREAAKKAAEEARIAAEQKRAEAAAAKKREEDERRARAAEAEQKEKAAAAERAAAEAKRKAEEAERAKAASEAAAARAASEQQARQAEADRIKASAEAAARRAESERQARQAEAERIKAEQASALEATCKRERTDFEALAAKGSEGTGVDDMKAFSKAVTCDRLRPEVMATIDKFSAEAARRAATLPNSPELVRAAQTQLVRIGCRSGKPDGALDAGTRAALTRYLTIKSQPATDIAVTEAMVSSLSQETGRVCPLQCKAGEIAKGDSCVSDKPAPTASRRRRDDDDDDEPVRRKPAQRRQAEREPVRSRPAAPEPRARQQAVARPSGGNTMIGVGF